MFFHTHYSDTILFNFWIGWIVFEVESGLAARSEIQKRKILKIRVHIPCSFDRWYFCKILIPKKIILYEGLSLLIIIYTQIAIVLNLLILRDGSFDFTIKQILKHIPRS